MTKIWDNAITDSTDWGGDYTTDDLPVSGERVQEYIKNRFAKNEKSINDEAKLRAIADTTLKVQLQEETKERNHAIQEEATNRNKQIVEEVAKEAKSRNTAIDTAIALEVQNRDKAIIKQSEKEAETRNEAIAEAMAEEAQKREQDISEETANRIFADNTEATKREQDIASINQQIADLKAETVVISESNFERLTEKDPNKTYYVYEEE